MKRIFILIAIVMSIMHPATLYCMDSLEEAADTNLSERMDDRANSPVNDEPTQNTNASAKEIADATPKAAEERLSTVEQRVDALEQKQSQFATHEEFTNLADGLAAKIQKFETKRAQVGNQDATSDETFAQLDTLLAELDDADDRQNMKKTPGKIITPEDEVEALLHSDSEHEDPAGSAPKKGKISPVPSSDSATLTDLAPQIRGLSNPSIAGAIALAFHLLGGKDRVKQACGPFNEPTKKAVAQLVEGAVLANVFNATWPKLSNGESRNGWAYTALFVAVHVGAKVLKPYVLQKLGTAAPADSNIDDSADASDDLDLDDTDPELKGLIKNLKNNVEWGQLLAEAAIAYALVPLLMGR